MIFPSHLKTALVQHLIKQASASDKHSINNSLPNQPFRLAVARLDLKAFLSLVKLFWEYRQEIKHDFKPLLVYLSWEISNRLNSLDHNYRKIYLHKLHDAILAGNTLKFLATHHESLVILNHLTPPELSEILKYIAKKNIYSESLLLSVIEGSPHYNNLIKETLAILPTPVTFNSSQGLIMAALPASTTSNAAPDSFVSENEMQEALRTLENQNQSGKDDVLEVEEVKEYESLSRMLSFSPL